MCFPKTTMYTSDHIWQNTRHQTQTYWVIKLQVLLNYPPCSVGVMFACISPSIESKAKKYYMMQSLVFTKRGDPHPRPSCSCWTHSSCIELRICVHTYIYQKFVVLHSPQQLTSTELDIDFFICALYKSGREVICEISPSTFSFLGLLHVGLAGPTHPLWFSFGFSSWICEQKVSSSLS